MGLGIALALVAAIGWGAGDVFARRAMLRASAAIVLAAALALIVVALFLLIAARLGPGALLPEAAWFFPLAALMGFFAYISGNLLYFHAMRRCGITIASPILGAGPLFSILLAVVLGGERPNLPTVGAAFLVVAGVAVIVTDRNRVLR